MRKPSSISAKTIFLITFIVGNLIICNVLGNLYTFNKQQVMKQQVSYNTKSDDSQIISQLDNLAGKPGEGYYLQVEIGTPKQTLNVLIDTGSSNLAIACEPNEDLSSYFLRNQSTTFKEMGKTVNVPYTQGSWNGILGQDYVTITSLPNSTVFATIACINQAEEFFINGSNWQGIMGLAYAGIARPDSSVEPIYDTMTKQGIVQNLFSIALCGMGFHSNSTQAPIGGSAVFGGIDMSLYTGDLYPTPIEKQWYYDILIVDILVNNQSLGMDCKEYNFGKTIVDTGTTNLRLPKRVFDQLVTQMKSNLRAVPNLSMPSEDFWSGLEVLCWDTGHTPYGSFPVITLTLPTNTTLALNLEISSVQYLRPVGDDEDAPGKDCFKLGISSIDSGTVIGAVIMEGYYVVFDRENNVVKFAESTCSNSVPLVPKSTVKRNVNYHGNYKDCAYIKPEDHPNTTMTVVGYILASVCGLSVIPLFTLMVYWNCKRCRKCESRERSDVDYSDLKETR